MENTKTGVPTGIKVLIGVVILTGLAVGGYFVYDYVKKPKSPLEPAPDKTPEPAPDKSSDYVEPKHSGGGSGGSKSDSFPLKKGSKGNNVTTLQNAINKYYAGYPAKQIGADSDYGSKTQAAVEGLYGKNKTEVVQGDIDWLNSHSYKAQQTKTPPKAKAKTPSYNIGGLAF